MNQVHKANKRAARAAVKPARFDYKQAIAAVTTERLSTTAPNLQKPMPRTEGRPFFTVIDDPCTSQQQQLMRQSLRAARVREKRLHYVPKHLTRNWEFPKGPARLFPLKHSKRTAKRLARGEVIRYFHIVEGV